MSGPYFNQSLLRKLQMQTSHVKSKSRGGGDPLEGATIELGGGNNEHLLGVRIICKDNFPDSNKWPVTKREQLNPTGCSCAFALVQLFIIFFSKITLYFGFRNFLDVQYFRKEKMNK